MSRTAIKYSDLLALADKHRIGKTDFVSLDAFFDDARAKAFKFTGVGRCNDWDIEADGCSKFEAARNRVNSENRYCKDITQLSKVLDVSRSTIYRWMRGWLGEIKPIRDKKHYKIYFDAVDVLSKWEEHLKSRQATQ